ncbi:MAG: hypothetical protein AB7V32_05805, partial [Candidatus Berkiella sp.]
MLNTLTNNAIVHWVSSQLSVECDLIYTHDLHQYHDIPGKADFAYVISSIGISFIDKRQNISRECSLNEEHISELKHRLKINSEVNENVGLIEEGISSEKLRAIHHYTRFHTPKTLMPIINTALVLSLFGFIPYAWMFYLPIFLAYNIYHYKTTGASVIRFTTNLVTFFRNFSRRFGEWFGETLTLYPNRIVKIVASSAILLFLGLNSWSLIAIYGIYRFKDNEWLNFFNKGISAIYNFCTGVFIKSLGKTSFYKRLGIGFGLAMLLATQSYVGGVFSLIMMGVLVANSIAIGIGFKALFRDLYYALRNPIKVAFKNTGKVIGALWGRYIAYRLLTGHVEGTLGPAIGHVESHGIFSGLFSSFLSPGGWFTTQSGWFGLL